MTGEAYIAAVLRLMLASLAAAALAAIAPCVALAGSAGPTVSLGKSKGLEYLKATYAQPVLSQASQPVDCDSDLEATGGGGSISGRSSNAALNESYPDFSGLDGWTVEGSTSGASGRILNAHVVCSAFETETLSPETTLGPDEAASLAPGCGVGGSAATGGGISGPASGLLVNATYPPPPPHPPATWYGLATNTADADRMAEFWVLCTGAFVVRNRSESTRLKAGESGKVAVACKDSEAVLGGGGAGLVDGIARRGTWLTASRPRDSKADRNRTPDDGWIVRGHNEGPGKVGLAAFAVCKRGLAT
jgi:hypothetical protein